MSQTFKGISRRARQLLATGESKEVDYKESVKGLSAEDIVAFANSESGGAILIGVKEGRNAKGADIGIPTGHAITDEIRLQIIAKALSCSPPIQIELFIESTKGKPFYRLEIPSGQFKPYCTSSGTYKIRENGRNGSILPPQLLKIFVEREAETFSKRFEQATGSLDRAMREALDSVGDLERAITGKIEEIGTSLGWAEYKAGDAADTIEVVRSQVDRAISLIVGNSQRIRAISRKVDAKDPHREKALKDLDDEMTSYLEKNPDVVQHLAGGESLQLKVNGPAAEELTEEEITKVFHDVAERVLKERGECKPENIQKN